MLRPTNKDLLSKIMIDANSANNFWWTMYGFAKLWHSRKSNDIKTMSSSRYMENVKKIINPYKLAQKERIDHWSSIMF